MNRTARTVKIKRQVINDEENNRTELEETYHSNEHLATHIASCANRAIERQRRNGAKRGM